MNDTEVVERVAGSDGKSYPASYVAHREAIRKAIEADPSATNTAIAKRMNSSRDTVIDVRRNMGKNSIATGARGIRDAAGEPLPVPDNLPAIYDAKLPASYESAVMALTKASRVDECLQWADKAMALASYARQSRDDSLYKMSIRIQSRATRRCGELLEQIAPAPGRPPAEIKGDAPPNLSRTTVARDAGLSDDQRKTALRVAAVPKADFERQVESDNPPTVTKLAEQGTKKRAVVERPDIPQVDCNAAAEVQAGLMHMRACCKHDPVVAARSFQPAELSSIRETVALIDAWMDRFAVSLPGR
jgi:hypothetical protein